MVRLSNTLQHSLHHLGSNVNRYLYNLAHVRSYTHPTDSQSRVVPLIPALSHIAWVATHTHLKYSHPNTVCIGSLHTLNTLRVQASDVASQTLLCFIACNHWVPAHTGEADAVMHTQLTDSLNTNMHAQSAYLLTSTHSPCAECNRRSSAREALRDHTAQVTTSKVGVAVLNPTFIMYHVIMLSCHINE